MSEKKKEDKTDKGGDSPQPLAQSNIQSLQTPIGTEGTINPAK